MIAETQIQQTDAYEEMAATWQCLEIARLNDVLKSSGVTSQQLRKEICSRYFFGSGDFLDSGWFECAGKPLHPGLCFAERQTPEANGKLGSIRTLHVQSDAFAFHGYAHGNIGWYFGQHDEDTSSIVTGAS